MTAILLTVVQVTLILALASLITGLLTGRSPSAATTVSFAGIIMAGVAVLASIAEAPRLDIALLRPVAQRPMAPNAQAIHVQQLRPDSKTPVGMPLASLSSWLGMNETPTAGTNSTRDWYRFSNLFYLIVLLSLIRLLWSVISVIRLTSRSRPYEFVWPPTMTRCLKQISPYCPAIRLRTSREIHSPCVTWLTPGTILVPNEFDDWSEQEKVAAITHEAAHILRRDARVRFAAELGMLLLCCHPLAILLRRQLIFAQELSTDRLAQQMLSGNRYKIGLCQLALRMDLQRFTPVRLGTVSVSTNKLVRRIKMLNSEVQTLPQAAQRLVIALSIAAATTVMAWDVRADEPLRLAARSKLRADASEALFDREHSQPWERLGNHEGYLKARPRLLAEKPLIAAGLSTWQNSLDLPQSTTQVSLAEDLDLWESSARVRVTETPEERRVEGKRFNLMLDSKHFMMTFLRDVNWPQVADRINLRAMLPAEETEPVRELLREQGMARVLRLVPKNEQDGPTVGDDVKSIWQQVDGGVIAAVLPTPANLPAVAEYCEEKDNAHAVRWLNVLQHCDLVGLGADLNSPSRTIHFRLVLKPSRREPASEVVTLCNSAIDESLRFLSSEHESSTDAIAERNDRWRGHLEGWSVRSMPLNKEASEIDSEAVVIEGTIADDFAFGL